MGKIKIQESKIKLTNGKDGKIAVLIYKGDDDPMGELDAAVKAYAGNGSRFFQFVDMDMDNPCVRVVVSGIREMEQEDFDPLKYKLLA